MDCIKCGNQLSPSDKFCSGCGSEVAQEKTKESECNSTPSNSEPRKKGIPPFIIFSVVTFVFGIFIMMASKEFEFVFFTNVPTTAIALTIGYYSLGTKRRRNMSGKMHAWLFIGYLPLALLGAMIEHDVKLSNHESLATSSATFWNLIYASLLAIVAYQIYSRIGARRNRQ